MDTHTPIRPDHECVSAYVHAHDAAALDELVRRYTPLAYRFSYGIVGNRHDAEDVAQQAFLKAWKNLASYDPSRSFKVWFLRIVKNTALDHVRSSKASRAAYGGGDEALAIVSDASLRPDESYDAVHDALRVRAAVRNLPAIYRMVIEARLDRDLTLEDIAGIFSEPVNTIKSRYLRGIALLRKRMALHG